MGIAFEDSRLVFIATPELSEGKKLAFVVVGTE